MSSTVKFVWSDFNADLSKTSNFSVASHLDVNAVKESIRNLLNTPKGSDLMDPKFGSSLYEFIFEPLDDLSINFINDMVEMEIKNFEERVELVKVSVKKNEDNSNIDISVVFKIKDSGLEDSLYYSIGLSDSTFVRP